LRAEKVFVVAVAEEAETKVACVTLPEWHSCHAGFIDGAAAI
jgi:hypothetical protein